MTVQPFQFSAKASRTQAPPISELMAEAVQNPQLISLAAGLVDYESLPVGRFRAAMEAVLAEPESARVALQYGTTAGLAALREALLAHLEGLDGVRREAAHLTPDNVVVTTGSQQLLLLLTDVLVDPGDIVITAAPSYFVYTGVLEAAGAEVRKVPADEGGMRIDALAACLEQCRDEGVLARVKIVYVVSYYDNPTGCSFARERRGPLVALIERFSADHRILVVEDAAYRELCYEGDAPPSIKSYDTRNAYVALAMTFSKPFAAGVKTGYGFLPDELIEPVLHQKGNHDFGSPNVLQHVLLRLLATGAYAAHVREVCDAYRRKRDVMLAALERELGDMTDVRWTRPDGGLYVWVALPEDIDTRRGGRLYRRCLDVGVLYVPGAFCYADASRRPVPQHQLRLSFGVARPEAIDEGVRRLARCLRDECRVAGGAGRPSAANTQA